jgi:hypothetical protein
MIPRRRLNTPECRDAKKAAETVPPKEKPASTMFVVEPV